MSEYRYEPPAPPYGTDLRRKWDLAMEQAKAEGIAEERRRYEALAKEVRLLAPYFEGVDGEWPAINAALAEIEAPEEAL